MSKPFFGRTGELSYLEEVRTSEGRRGVSIFGRRCVGKTELILQFIKGKRSIYIPCASGTIQRNLENISEALHEFDSREFPQYSKLPEALRDLYDVCSSAPTILAIDELPYIIEADADAASDLQHFFDKIYRNTESMVIVCGSSISMMVRETTDNERPLAGRFPWQLEVLPLSFQETTNFHPRMSEMDRIRLYLTVGGIPEYHQDSSVESYEEYVKKYFLSPNGKLTSSAETLISTELSPKTRYSSIVSTIADGSTSLKEIVEKTKIDKTTCGRYLSNLMKIGIVDEVPSKFDSPKNPIYRIVDPITWFWQSVGWKMERYRRLDPDQTYSILKPSIDTFLGLRFEDLCTEYVKTAFKTEDVGKWRGVDRDKKTKEIDIAATIYDGEGSYALFGECKFWKDPVGYDVMSSLLANTALVRTDLPKRCILFSTSGFTPSVISESKTYGIVLVDLKELCSDWS